MQVPLSKDHALAIAALNEYDRLSLSLARTDVNEFVERVLLDDRTGRPVLQSPVHERFHALCDRHKRLIIWGHAESGKTSQISIARVCFLLGQNPNLRIGIFSSKVEQANKTGEAIRRYIETNSALKAIFPHLKPGKPWGGTRFSVQRSSLSREPSVSIYSVGTDRILGSRLDLVILDDVLTNDNTSTEVNRKRVIDWYYANVPGRVVDGGQIIFIGNAFHPDDLMHELAKNPSWHWERFPVYDPETGTSFWPDQWPIARVEAKRAELTPHEFARQMLCLARDEEATHFSRESIKRCMDRGEGKRTTASLSYVPPGYEVYTGVDLATGRKRGKGDRTSFFTIAIHPNGDREVLNVESGRWQAPEIVRRIVETHQRFHSIIVVESNAAQVYIEQFTKSVAAVPIIPFNTGANKTDPNFGVQSIAVEMSNGKWIIPSEGGLCHPEIAAWIQEMVYYDPNAHTGDRLMSSWFAREGARRKKRQNITVGRLNLLRR